MEIHLRKAFFVIEKKFGPIKANLRYDSIWSHHGVKEALIFRNQTQKKNQQIVTGVLTLYVFSVVPYCIKTSQMVCNASQLTGFYVINRAKEWGVILYFDQKIVVIQDKSNKTIMYWSIYDFILVLKSQQNSSVLWMKLHLSVMILYLWKIKHKVLWFISE